jgi:O-antigen/teichoic acid export membrane protein
MDMVQFGEFASLVSIVNILWVLVLWINIYLTREYSKNTDNLPKVKSMSNHAIILLAWLGIILVGVFILCVPYIKVFLHFESPIWFYSIGILVFISCLWIGYNPVFRAMKMFKYLAFFQVLNPLLKIVFGIWLVSFWLGIFWAMGWFIISSMLTLILAYIVLYRRFRNIDARWTLKSFIAWIHLQKRELMDFVIWSILFAVLMNSDILFAKNIFEPTIAWTYAGMAIISKFLIYLLLSIETVYYVQIMELSKKTAPIRYFIEPIAIMVGVTFISLIWCYFFWDYIMSVIHLEIVWQNIALLLLVWYSGLLAYLSFISNILIGYKTPWVNTTIFIWLIIILTLFSLVPLNSFIAFVLYLLLPTAWVCAILSFMLIKMLIWR